MRPTTLAETYERIIVGTDCDVGLAEFLDTFYITPTAEGRLETLRGEPRLTGDERLDALAGAMAEYLARQYERPNGHSCWAFEPSRYLEHVWHTCSINSPGMREYLTYSSPAEFASRNIFTEERPLHRARSSPKQS
jgi:hypothetical protein